MKSVECVAPTGPPVVPDQDRTATDAPEDAFGGLLETLMASAVQGEVQAAATEGEAAEQAVPDGGTPVPGVDEGQAGLQPMAQGEAVAEGVVPADASAEAGPQRAATNQSVEFRLDPITDLMAQELGDVPLGEGSVVPTEEGSEVAVEQVPLAIVPGAPIPPGESDAPVDEGAAALVEEVAAQLDGEKLIVTVDRQVAATVADETAPVGVEAAAETTVEAAQQPTSPEDVQPGIEANAMLPPNEQAEASAGGRNVVVSAPETVENVSEVTGGLPAAVQPEVEAVAAEGQGEAAPGAVQPVESSPAEVGLAQDGEPEAQQGLRAQISAEGPEVGEPFTASKQTEVAVQPEMETAKAVAQSTPPLESRPSTDLPTSETGEADRGVPAGAEVSGKLEAQSYEYVAGERLGVPSAHATDSASVEQGRAATVVSPRPVQSSPSEEAHPKLVPQATMAVRLALHSPQRSARLTLEPPHLGRLQVEIAVEEGRVSAIFRAGTDSARQGLLQSMDYLRESIEEHGVRVGNLNVLLDTGAGRFGHNFAHGQSSDQRGSMPNSRMSQEPGLSTEDVTVGVPSARMLDVVV